MRLDEALRMGRKLPFDGRLHKLVDGLLEGRLHAQDAVARRVVEISTSAAVPAVPAQPIPSKKEDEELQEAGDFKDAGETFWRIMQPKGVKIELEGGDSSLLYASKGAKGVLVTPTLVDDEVRIAYHNIPGGWAWQKVREEVVKGRIAWIKAVRTWLGV